MSHPTLSLLWAAPVPGFELEAGETERSASLTSCSDFKVKDVVAERDEDMTPPDDYARLINTGRMTSRSSSLSALFM